METTETRTRPRGEPRPGEHTTNKAVSFYPNHIAVIERVARTEHRNFSNALQVIVERYERTLREGKR